MLTTALAAGSHLRLTRMDIPFLLGTAFTDDRTRARGFGYALHFVAGLIFALFYYAGFVVLGQAQPAQQLRQQRTLNTCLSDESG